MEYEEGVIHVEATMMENVKLEQTVSSVPKSEKQKQPKAQPPKDSDKNQQNERKPNQHKATKLEHQEETPQQSEQSLSLEAQIAAFCKDTNAIELEFPLSLTSFERMCVHEIAEKYQLQHTSRGEANKRYICVRKQQESAVENISPNQKEEEIEVKEELTVPLNKPKTKKKKKKPSVPQPKLPKPIVKPQYETNSNDIDELLEAAIER
jgi:ATP-dependent RNA/DNA helicase IGHMBP2